MTGTENINQFLTNNPGFFFLIISLAVVDLSLRAISIWKAVKAHQKGWFISLLIFNTIGILPAIYLYFFAPKKS